MNFMGYVREDGQVGVRNHVIVVSTTPCANSVVEQIAQSAGVVPITHPYGCNQMVEDSKETEWVLARYAENPNVAAALVVGLGCEQIDAARLAEEISGKPTEYVIVRDGGTVSAASRGVEKVQKMKIEVSKLKREETPLSKISLMVECCGSDSTSGLAANPALGAAADLLIKEGGAVIFETAAFGEHVLLRNVTDRKLIDRVWKLTELEAERTRRAGEKNYREIMVGPEGIRQGLTTITEKRLGVIAKGGSTPLRGVLTEREKPPGSGLWWGVLDDRKWLGCGAAYFTLYLLRGCQIMCVTTGVGDPEGTAIAPVIKITGNYETYDRMIGNMDVNAGRILLGEETVEDVGKRIFEEIVEVADGKLTKAESLGHREFVLPTYLNKGYP